MVGVIRIILFIVGALGLLLTGLSVAEHFNVDTAALLNAIPGGVDECAYDLFGQGLAALGGFLPGGESEDGASLVATWGPVGIAGLVSLLLLFLSARR
ncbi:MAG: hypothetical protein AB7P23_08390 [Amphiplicatus sp.]